MTADILEHHAISRRQYSLLVHRELRRTRREMRRLAVWDCASRVCGYVAYAASIIIITLAFGGWMNI